MFKVPRVLAFYSSELIDRETVISVYWVPFCLYMDATVVPLVAGADNNTSPVRLKGENWTYQYGNIWVSEINPILRQIKQKLI